MQARASDIPELKGFATKLRQDQDAVVAALTLPYSQGQTEGFITKLKLLKRSMYGRAKLDLLRGAHPLRRPLISCFPGERLPSIHQNLG